MYCDVDECGMPREVSVSIKLIGRCLVQEVVKLKLLRAGQEPTIVSIPKQ